MKQELTWELIEQALDEHKLEILQDYNYFEWLQNEMRKIRKKYEKPERQYVKPNLHADEMDWCDSIVQRIAREVHKDEQNLTPRQEAQKERIENSPVIKPNGEFIF